MAKFPDSRIAAASRRLPKRSTRPVTVSTSVVLDRDESVTPLPAYSGVTVWASHPLRMAARVNVDWARV